jgi:hypothetical protein
MATHERYSQTLGWDSEPALCGLAQAISASAGWPPGCTAVVTRLRPQPLIAVIGSLASEAEDWLRAQARTLGRACHDLRYVDYGLAQQACDELASRLLDLLGPGEVDRACFAAVPRGGLIVLGILASILGLQREQINTTPTPDGLLVVVDDCALSGARFASFLRTNPARRILFAPLFSHPALRSAIEAAEPRVVGCVSARDLISTEPAPASSPPPNGTERFWTGRLEPIAFPWNEPDRLLWNKAEERYELAWRIVPPELCLKNRPAPGTTPIPVQIQPEGKGPLRPAERSLFAEIDGSVVLFDLETGQGFSLAGIGSDLWRSIVRLGDLEAVISELGRAYDAPEAILRDDAARFTDDLLARGLLKICENRD